MKKLKLGLNSTLSNLTTENVKEVYQQNYNRWRYKHSDIVIVNGEEITDPFEKAFLQYTGRNISEKAKADKDKDVKEYLSKITKADNDVNIQTLEISDTIGGLPLKEVDFINEELAKCQKGTDDLLEKKRTEIYLEYLNKRKNEISDNKAAFNKGLNSPYDDETLGKVFDRLTDLGWFIGEKSNFIAIFRPESAPAGWQPVEYILKKGKDPHQSALPSLIIYLSENETGYNRTEFFTVDGKPFSIGKNKTYSISSDLKGIVLKKR